MFVASAFGIGICSPSRDVSNHLHRVVGSSDDFLTGNGASKNSRHGVRPVGLKLTLRGAFQRSFV
jgi:hypothetical protein